jgi:hypothetical protein
VPGAEGAAAGWPREENRAANWVSAKTGPTSSRMRMITLPLGQAARAIWAVNSGIGGTVCGCNDMAGTFLLDTPQEAVDPA